MRHTCCSWCVVTCRKKRFRGNPFGVKIQHRCPLWQPLAKHLFLRWAVVEECGSPRLEGEEQVGYWFDSGWFFLFFCLNKNLVGRGSCSSRSMFSRPCRTCSSWPLWYQTCSSCWAVRQWTRQHFELTQHYNLGSLPLIQIENETEWADSREGLFEVVGFDAAHVVRSRSVQGVHEQMQRRPELKDTETCENRSRKHHDAPESPAELTWCPTVFLCSLFGALGTVFSARTFTLADLAGTTSSLSLNRSATSWNWGEEKKQKKEVKEMRRAES